MLVPYRMRLRHGTIQTLKACSGLIAVVSLCGGVWLYGVISDRTSSKEEAKIRHGAPRPINDIALRRQNEQMRLEPERLGVERQPRYRRLTDSQVMGELTLYCPSGDPPCSVEPPTELLLEAAHRGLIIYLPSAP